MNLSAQSLRIVHVLRAPVGGLFRHVLDIAREQAARGHQIGVIADSTTGGETANRQFAQLAPSLRLGIERFPMRREPHPNDILASLRVWRAVLRMEPDVLHGHGSKGGLYTRAMGFMPCRKRILRAYTPHGGSFHRQPGHALYMAVEKLVESKTDLLLFESDYIARQFAEGVGESNALQMVAKNGLRPEEFTAVPACPDAAEFLYIGELSTYKGVDTLIRALATIHAETELKPRLVIVGSGAEFDKLARLVEHHDLNRHIAFYGALPAREAFALGRIVVTPSRAKSLPYVAMEAIAADKTIVATDVGGMGEIFGPVRDRLVPRDCPNALAAAMLATLRQDEAEAAAARQPLRQYVADHFNVRVMVNSGLRAYALALARLEKREPAPAVAAQ